MGSSTTIGLLLNGRMDEAIAVGACEPGHLLQVDSDLKVKKHAVIGGRGPVLVALEHSLEGNYARSTGVGIMDAYAVADRVLFARPIPGDIMNMRVPAGAAAIVASNLLMSDGAGGVVKVPVSGGTIISQSVAASTGVTNTVSTEQDFDVTASVPANLLKAGDVITIKGMAVVSAAAGTDTLTIKVYAGATELVTSAAVNATTGDVVHFEITVVIRTAGASGTFVASGEVYNGAASVGTSVVDGVGSTAWDTTAAKTIKASATWSATTATCTVALQSLTVELNSAAGLNPLFQAQEALDNSAESDSALLPCLVL